MITFRHFENQDSIDDIYGRSVTLWHSLRKLFASKVERPPKIFVYLGEPTAQSPSLQLRSTLEVAPTGATRAEKRTLERAVQTHPGKSLYSVDRRLVLYNRYHPAHILVEELTHDLVIPRKSRLTIDVNVCKEFDSYCSDYWPELLRQLAPHGTHWTLDMAEFFPPLAQARHSGHAFHYVSCYWAARLYDLDDPAVAKDYMLHLPQLAGELLVEHHKGDVEGILRKYHSLLRSDGWSLWHDYCKPILRGTLGNTTVYNSLRMADGGRQTHGNR